MGNEKIAIYMSYFISFLVTVIGLPLALKFVEPNSWYGVRTAKTMQDQDIWYAVNFSAGLGLVLSGLICCGLIYLVQNHLNLETKNTIVLISMIPVIVPITVLGGIFAFS